MTFGQLHAPSHYPWRKGPLWPLSGRIVGWTLCRRRIPMSWLGVEPHFLPHSCLSLVFQLTSYIKVQYLALRRFRRIAKNDYQLHHSCLPGHLQQLAFHSTVFWMKYDVWVFFKKSFKKVQFLLKSDKNNVKFLLMPPIYVYLWQYRADFFT